MRLEDRFTAAPDKLRALKNGANPALLDTWMGLLFPNAGAWTREREAALDTLARHPSLPATGLSLATLPAFALQCPEGLDHACRLGADPRRIRPERLASVRGEALVRNAPPETHACLDAGGVAPPSLADLSKALPPMIEALALHSFCYLANRPDKPLDLAFAERGPLVINAVRRWERGFSIEGERARAAVLMRMLSTAGAPLAWGLEEALDAMAPAARALGPVTWADGLRRVLAEHRATVLDATWAPSPEIPPSRPRSRL